MFFCTQNKQIECTPPKVEKGVTPDNIDAVALTFTLLKPTDNVIELLTDIFYFYDEHTGRVLAFTEYAYTYQTEIKHNTDGTKTINIKRSVKR